MKERIETFPLFGTSTSVTVVDSPGHPRLRTSALDYVPVSHKILFLIKAPKASLTKLTAEADVLYDVLSHPNLAPHTQLLIVQHEFVDPSKKQSPPSSRSLETLQRQLEAELSQLMTTRHTLTEEGLEEEEEGNHRLGRPGQSFQFEVDAPCDVTFGWANVHLGKLDDIQAFLQE